MLGKREKVMYSLAMEMEYQFAESLRANYNFLLSYNCWICMRGEWAQGKQDTTRSISDPGQFFIQQQK